MKFFSGFSLQNENYLFDKYIKKGAYTVGGFSYGAIKAFQYVKDELEKGKRIDTLELFSPAFFQTKDTKFKRLQLMAYKKNEMLYLNQFINKCFDPYEKKIVEHTATTVDQLDELLNYQWSLDSLEEIKRLGVEIEVYVGEKDAIVDAEATREFFKEVATLTYLKNANHFLQIN